MSVKDSIAGWKKSAPLVKKAEELGIEIDPLWWFGSADPKPEPGFKVHIRGIELGKLRKLVRDEQMRRRKEWIEILSPLAGWIVAIIALLKDVLLAIVK
jgi:hypothetical protein